jgi:flagellar P-ring protein precursor FlgI
MLWLAVAIAPAASGVALRDLVMVAGARDNQLVGFGMVAGLAGEGDTDPIITQTTIANLLRRYGIDLTPYRISARNVAVVMVTADIPPFVKPGARLDVQVASMGNANSLQGGVLLQTPLLGADNKVYAVAQGPLCLGGFVAGNRGFAGATVTKNHPTVATIIDGAIVEKEIQATIVRDDSIELLLREPGYTSAARMAAAINRLFTNSACALDSTAVRVHIPTAADSSPVDFLARLEAIDVDPETPARIIINERTGTIVATSRIQISSCVVSHGNITISVASTPTPSRPSPPGDHDGATGTASTATELTETKAPVVPLPEMPTVEKVATALNSLGATPRDIMAIFEAMKQAGALQAELIIR